MGPDGVEDPVRPLHACSSVAPRMGRKDTLIPGGSVRPAALAARCTEAICSAVSASGSPHSAKVSACLPPTAYAASEEPPKYRGMRGR
ncbi:hypothetical protein SANTM175S_10434 [Streptomyces antimycoticus]